MTSNPASAINNPRFVATATGNVDAQDCSKAVDITSRAGIAARLQRFVEQPPDATRRNAGIFPRDANETHVCMGV
jgi:hypothetical protein